MFELSVCIGSSCHLKGSYNIIQIFQQLIEEHKLHDKIDFKATFCMKQCQNDGVSVSYNGSSNHIKPEMAREFFQTTILPLLS
ncbi:MAG: (2Fe-2S) ferredoxin domain-containing protein [Anaerocolumna sp.]